MATPKETVCESGAERAWFTTTHWSVVLSAGDPGSTGAAEALESLCRRYWYPLYVFARRQGCGADEAKDFTQEFFARLLEKNYLSQVSREKGKFRSFMLAAMKHFLGQEWKRERTQKRGGGRTFISLDDTNAEERYGLEPADVTDPAKLYERGWALALVEQAQERVKEEHRARGKLELYERLLDAESGEKGAPTYREIGRAFGLSEEGARTAGFRMRRRRDELLREEVANTVSGPEEVDEELRYLKRVLKGDS